MRFRFLPAALAAFVATGLLTACGGPAATPAPAPLQSLAGVADTSRAAATGRFEFSMTMELDGQSMAFSGGGAYDNPAKRGQISFDMSSFAQLLGGLGQAFGGGTAELEGFDDPSNWKLEGVLDDGLMYLRFPLIASELPEGVEWVKLDLATLAAQQGTSLGQLGSFGSTDPRAALDALEAVSGPLEVAGREDVRGVPTTHYRAKLDPAKIAQEVANNAGAAGAGADVLSGFQEMLGQLGLAELPLDVWVDDAGLLRRFVIDLEASPAGGLGEMKVGLEFELFDYGVPVEIELPPADKVADAAALGLNP